MMLDLRLAIRNLAHRPGRSLLMIATLAVSTFIVTTMVSIPASIDRIVEDSAVRLHLIVTAPNAYQMPLRYRDEIKRLPHVTACVAQLTWSALYRSPRDIINGFAIDTDIGTVYSEPEFQLTPEQNRQLARDRRGAVAGSVLMREHNWHVGQQILLKGNDGRFQLPLIIMAQLPAPHAPNQLIIRRQLLDETVKGAFGEDISDRVSFFAVRVDRAENIDLVIREIDENFHNSEAQTQTMTESDAIANNISDLGALRPIVYALCALVIVNTLLIIGNSIAMKVRERISDVAVMRSLGFSRLRVFTMSLSEAVLLGLAGGLIGGLLALWLFIGGVSLGAVVSGTGYMAVAPVTALAAIAGALALSVLSAVVPALGAARIAPAAAFRQIV
jgi:putative ABC transport system permease protein